MMYQKWLTDIIWPSDQLKEMMKHSIYKKDFNWLYSDFDEINEAQEVLIDELNKIQFVYKPSIVRDSDRIADGRDLRDKFLMEHRYPGNFRAKYLDYMPISVLEVFVALSYRCDTDIQGDPDYPGLTAPLWFWSMIKNLDIFGSGVTDEASLRRSIDYKIDQFMDRKYSYYGDGGPFPVDQIHKDLRKVDLWMQMNWWLTENFGPNSVLEWSN